MPQILLILLGVFLVYLIYIYNQMVSLRNRYEGAWSDVDVQLKKRHDLVPNLVLTVQGYAVHESETLENVVLARRQGVDAKGVATQEKAEDHLSMGLVRLFALAEDYPELKADQNFLQLQEQLIVIEDDIQNARRYFNAVIRDFNTLTESFPNHLFVSMFGFAKQNFFSLESISERVVPKIDFDHA